MTPILYLAGLVIAVLAFIYILRILESGKKKLQQFSEKKSENMEKIQSKNITVKNYLGLPPGDRICPVCRQTLTKYDALYASKSSGNKILIHGCKYCYKD